MDLDKQLALNKKLAEWAGFIEESWGWNDPNGEIVQSFPLGVLPDFTQSLDACFKWLVPKLPHMPYITLIKGKDYWFCRAESQEGTGETPALALCKAIEKLIDGGA